MSKTLGPSPGAARHPEHQIRVVANAGRWTVTVNGTRVADSEATLVNAPFFNGVTSVTNPQDPSCGLDVSWNTGSTLPRRTISMASRNSFMRVAAEPVITTSLPRALGIISVVGPHEKWWTGGR